MSTSVPGLGVPSLGVPSLGVPSLGVPSLGVPGSMILGSAGTAGVIGSTPDGLYVVSLTDITLPTRQTTRHFGRAALGTR